MYDSTTTNGYTKSLWHNRLSAEDAASLTGEGPLCASELRVDVAVIGAGMAGLSVAYHLCQGGQTVAVIDKGLIGSGETGRTTAHLSNAVDDRYAALVHTLGEAGAQLTAASHTAAVADIERIVAAEQIACEFRRVPGYLASVQEGAAADRELREELRAARRAGLEAELVYDGAHPFARGWCIRFEGQAQFQPLAYLAGLARAIARMGGHIFTNTRVLGIGTADTPVVVQLEGGRNISARDVVLATNTPIHDRFAMHTKQAPYRSYVVAYALPEPMPPALWWDTGDPYHYVRLAEGGSTLIVGGEDHKVGQVLEPEHAWTKLDTWTRAHFPHLGELQARWSGQIQEPFDGMAFIGHNPGISRHVFIVSGDSGNGMTHGAIAGLLLPELIREQPHPWSRIYDPTRKPKRGTLGPFVYENANVALHFAEGVLGAQPEPAHKERGTGTVFRRGLARIAQYVGDDGSVHERSAVCPHLGCIVQWNRAEQSWDCPCHGSRFDPYGCVLTGPAMHDLAREQSSSAENHEPERQDPMQSNLVQHLRGELWQTETSASQHCRREAARLGDTPPAAALLAVAQHADDALATLPKVFEDLASTHSGMGMAVGKIFSEIRDTLADKLLTSERSYRGTLLGLRHGVDLVRLMLASIPLGENLELRQFLESWLSRREPLVEDVAGELRWFAQHQEHALKHARGLFSAAADKRGHAPSPEHRARS